MTLLERCRTLRGAVDRRNEMKRAHKDSEVFRERLAELQTMRAALSETLARLAILREKGVAVVPLPSAAVTLKVTATFSPTSSLPLPFDVPASPTPVSRTLRPRLKVAS